MSTKKTAAKKTAAKNTVSKKTGASKPARNLINRTGYDTKAREVVQKELSIIYMGETFSFKSIDEANKFFDECVNNSQEFAPTHNS